MMNGRPNRSPSEPGSSTIQHLCNRSHQKGIHRLACDQQVLDLLMSMVPKCEYEAIEDPPADLLSALAGLSAPRLLGVVEVCIALLLSRSDT